MNSIRLPNGWQPRPYQVPAWEFLSDGGLRACIVAHRRWGKDDIALNHTACAAHERVGNYVHMLPEASQVRKAIWQAVNPRTGIKRIDQAFPESIRARTHDQEMFIEFLNGSTWQAVGSDNYNSLVGSGFAGIVGSEFALANPAAWGYFEPMLLENDGWFIAISTPRGKNHMHAMYEFALTEPGWFAQLSTADDTNVFRPEQLASELRRLQKLHGEEYGRALWRQEYFCSFDAAIPGSIWGEAIAAMDAAGRITEFEVNRQGPVNTGWDLGRTDDTSIWWHNMVGRQIDVFDFFSKPGMDICNEDAKEKSLVHLLLDVRRRHGINYGVHWLPHDARPRTQAAGGRSILQQFLDARKKYPELGRFAIVPRLDKMEGIQAARATFPLCRFHASNCKGGIEALRHYHREWDDDLQMFRDVPKHDWASHPADAWRSVALTWKIRKPDEITTPLEDRLLSQSVSGDTFGRLKERHLRRRRNERNMRLD